MMHRTGAARSRLEARLPRQQAGFMLHSAPTVCFKKADLQATQASGLSHNELVAPKFPVLTPSLARLPVQSAKSGGSATTEEGKGGPSADGLHHWNCPSATLGTNAEIMTKENKTRGEHIHTCTRTHTQTQTHTHKHAVRWHRRRRRMRHRQAT